MTGKKLKKTFRAIVMKAICFHGPELLHLFRPLVYVFIFVLGLSLFAADVAKAADNEQNQKPRLLVLTDIGDDPDDEQSMVRLLVYANAFEIEGFVTELWWKDTHKGRHGAMTSESQMKLLHHMLDLYGQVRPKLERHEKGYPQADALQKVIKRGKIGIQMTLSKPKGDPLQWIVEEKDSGGRPFRAPAGALA